MPPRERTKILRSVLVNLSRDEITKIIKDHLEKEGFEVRNVDFKVAKHTKSDGVDSHVVWEFDECAVSCRLITERSEDG